MDSQVGHYEFSPAQNEILKRAARWTGLFAWIMMVGSGLMAVGAVFSGEAASVASLIAAAIYFIVGLSFRGAASSFQAVVQTTGNDMDHLMVALDKVASAFKVMSIVFLVGVILLVVATVAVWAWMASVST
jgi:uncharacterized membrane protein YczE